MQSTGFIELLQSMNPMVVLFLGMVSVALIAAVALGIVLHFKGRKDEHLDNRLDKRRR